MPSTGETRQARQKRTANATICQCGHSFAWHQRGKVRTWFTGCQYPGCKCSDAKAPK